MPTKPGYDELFILFLLVLAIFLSLFLFLIPGTTSPRETARRSRRGTEPSYDERTIFLSFFSQALFLSRSFSIPNTEYHGQERDNTTVTTCERSLAAMNFFFLLSRIRYFSLALFLYRVPRVRVRRHDVRMDRATSTTSLRITHTHTLSTYSSFFFALKKTFQKETIGGVFLIVFLTSDAIRADIFSTTKRRE